MAVPGWTVGRLRAFITSTIRGGFRRYPPKFETLKEAFVRKGINPSSGRMASLYRCASCLGEYSAKEVQVDHVDPVVDPVIGFVSWDVFIERLFCAKENLQVLCKGCHLIKTKEEKLLRKKTNAI